MLSSLSKLVVHLIAIVVLVAFFAAERNCPQIFSGGCEGTNMSWIIPFFISLFGGLAFPVLSLMFILQKFFPHKRSLPIFMIYLAVFVGIFPMLYAGYRAELENRKIIEKSNGNRSIQE
jgi:archaellum biogenesis protein FlaJ (TadC family)